MAEFSKECHRNRPDRGASTAAVSNWPTIPEFAKKSSSYSFRTGGPCSATALAPPPHPTPPPPPGGGHPSQFLPTGREK